MRSYRMPSMITKCTMHSYYNMASLRTKLFLTVVIWSAIAGTSVVLATCGSEMPPLPSPGESDLVTIVVDDPNVGPIERTFKIHIPKGYPASNDAETPLVLDFHGFAGTSSSQGRIQLNFRN